jgi:hypothetical protein
VKIFLDIDGVMIRGASWKSVELLNDGFPAFSNKAVSSLNKIIEKTGASILLTTSHKSNYTINQWKGIFSKRGIVASIKKLNKNNNHLSRKDEILNWLENHHNEDESFVILDDDKCLNDLPSEIKERLVLTSSLIGLTDDHVELVVNILKNTDSIFV